LQAYDWPGNVRELEMMVRVAACHAPPGGRVDLVHLPLRGRALGNGTSTGDSLRTARAAWERTALIRAVRENSGVVSRAAKSLRLTRQAFYKAMRRTGLSPEDVRGVRRSRPSLNRS
jgi:transcriptional regulator of acetoin/glycerol metabolism